MDALLRQGATDVRHRLLLNIDDVYICIVSFRDNYPY